jgi:sulfatase modifying factor 1
MPRIFISYRREDSELFTGRLHDRLEPHFGRENVFMDIDDIPFGVDFRKHLDEAVSRCDVLLAIIGENWLNVCHREGPRQGSRRLEDPADFVRIEILSALARGIPVIPVLVGGARVPTERELPEGLKDLAYRHAAEVRGGRDFKDHVARLIRGLEQLLRVPQERSAGDPGLPPDPHPAPKSQRVPQERSAGAVEAVALGGGVEMTFAWCPPGTFLMGSPAGEAERSDDELQHRVTLTKGFWLGIHQVTQAQWQAVMGDNPSNFKGVDLPVDNVSWEDCQKFVEKAGKKIGKEFRVPTEAEWEYACRAGTTTPFSFGQTISTDQANYDGNYTYADGRKGVYRKKTTPVGTFPANLWGLHDMHGNVWEWCADWYGTYQKEDLTDPKGIKSGDARVLRGGSWGSYPGFCRAAFRYWFAPGYRSVYCGCRVVLCLD